MVMNSPARTSENPAARVGNYTITRKIGEGGFATVFEGVHVSLKKRVAIKFLNRSYTKHEELMRRFLQEGEAASRIRHPHVVDITDVGTHEGIPYLVMEYLDGEDLGEYLYRNPVLDERTTAELMLPVISAVFAAHEKGVLHRDLKPENIMLTKGKSDDEFHPVVLDFGVSEINEGEPVTGSVQGIRFGTPCYMSPERVLTGRSGAACDQFALGAILYEMVTGISPFDRGEVEPTLSAIKTNDYVPPRARRPDLDPAFETLIMRAIADDESERFESVLGLALSLLPFARRRVRVFWEHELGIDRGENDIAPPRSIEELRPSERPTSGIIGAATMSDEDLRDALRSSSTSLDLTGSVPIPHAAEMTSVTPEQKSKGWLWALLALLLAGAIGVGIAVMMRQPTAETATRPATFRVQLQVTPSSATVELDGEEQTLPLDLELATNGSPHNLVISAPGHERQQISFRDSAPPAWIRLTPLPSQPQVQETAAETQVEVDEIEEENVQDSASNESSVEETAPQAPSAPAAAVTPARAAATPTRRPTPMATNNTTAMASSPSRTESASTETTETPVARPSRMRRVVNNAPVLD